MQAGQIDTAQKHFDAVDADSDASDSQRALNRALLAIAKGEWFEAQRLLAPMLETDPENASVSSILPGWCFSMLISGQIANNLAVVLVSLGKVAEVSTLHSTTDLVHSSCVQATEILESSLQMDPTAVTAAEPVLFNIGASLVCMHCCR